MRLTLVGTGHVFRIGEAIQRLIAERTPHVVCVELDPVRLAALKERAKLAELEAAGDPRAQTMRAQHEQAVRELPFLYRFLARLQERLAGREGVEAGSEMLAAVAAAERLGVPVATIDVDAQDLIRRAWKQMGWRERFRFIWALGRGQGTKRVDDEMERYEEDPVAYLAQVGDEFPALKRVLIDDRDAHMARALVALRARGRSALAPAGSTPHDPSAIPADTEALRIVAVVGDGHVEGMLVHLRAHFGADEIEVVRVRQLRDDRVPDAPGTTGPSTQVGDTTSVTLHVDVPNVTAPEAAPPSGPTHERPAPRASRSGPEFS